MPAVSNTQIIYKEIPVGLPDPAKTFEIRKGTIVLDEVQLNANGILIKTLYASVDPYMRMRMRDPSIKTYFPAAVVGKPMSGGIIGEVVKTKNNEFTVGDVVVAFGDWTEYSVLYPSTGAPIKKIPNARSMNVPLSYYLGVLGMPGCTAYVGLHKICEPMKKGETLYVSAAAGAVGQVVGQYGKALGLRVVGSAGDDAKVAYLKELGFDEAFNYKKHSDYNAILKETCPNGIDIYFENVGGKMLDAVLMQANDFARIPVCGMISQYNRGNNPEGNYALGQLINKRIRMEGFINTDDIPKYGKQFIETFTKLIQEGKLKYREDVSKGIEKLPEAFVGMLEGKNFGKAVVEIAKL